MPYTTENRLANTHARRVMLISEDLAALALDIETGAGTEAAAHQLHDYADQLIYIANHLQGQDASRPGRDPRVH